jgi:hypothetical protein
MFFLYQLCFQVHVYDGINMLDYNRVGLLYGTIGAGFTVNATGGALLVSFYSDEQAGTTFSGFSARYYLIGGGTSINSYCVVGCVWNIICCSRRLLCFPFAIL